MPKYHTMMTSTTQVTLLDKNNEVLKRYSLRDVLEQGLARAYGWEQE